MADPNLDELAAQFGGKVAEGDMDALAKKYGGSASGEPTPKRGDWETFSVPSRPRQFVSPEDQPARMVTSQKGTRQVPVEGPTGRAIYELGGKTTDVLTAAGLPPEAAAAGGYLANVGAQAATSFGGGNLGSKLEPASQALGKYFMRRALNPLARQIETGKADRVVETMLEQPGKFFPGENVSRAGVERMSKDIEMLNGQIMEKIRNSPETVNKQKVAVYAQKAYNKWKDQVNSASDLKAVREAVDEFLKNPAIAENMPAEVAQRLKQGTYRSLGAKAYEPGSKTASIDAQKDLARGLKEELAAKHPGIREANTQESKLLEARAMAERALAKDDAKAKVGFGWLAKNPEAAAGYMAERSPYIQSMLARYFYHHADPTMAGRAAGAGLGAYYGQPSSELEREMGK